MKYFTGDESGLIKWIAFPPKSAEKPRKKAKTEDGKEETPKLQPLLGVFGKVDKEKAVQKLAWATYNKEKVLLVARKDGSIQFLSPENGQVKKEFTNTHVGAEENKGRFVGLYIHNDHLVVCTSNGDLSYTSLKSKKQNTDTILDLGPNLEIMRGHPTQTNIFAIGGKDRDLAIYDLSAIIKKTRKSKQDTTDIGPHKNTSPHKTKSEKNTGLIFQAKNVKNDFLDLQQPVWIHDLQFMNQEATVVAVSTHYHQLRVYDTKQARRPILNKEIGKQPIKVLSVGTDFDHVLFADTMSTVGMLNIHTGKTAALFKGFTGAATDLLTVPQPQFSDSDENKERFVASVSLDRFLRVHETATVYRRSENKAYVKQRLTCVLVDEEYEYPVPKKEKEQEEEEEDAMWESMETVKDRKRKHV